MDTSQDASPFQGHKQNNALQSQTLSDSSTYVTDPNIYGNINNDDITKEMYSQTEPEQQLPPEPPNHHVAQSKGNKAMKC